jgi:hypothetical protein
VLAFFTFDMGVQVVRVKPGMHEISRDYTQNVRAGDKLFRKPRFEIYHFDRYLDLLGWPWQCGMA